jgi:hypothetical protein
VFATWQSRITLQRRRATDTAERAKPAIASVGGVVTPVRPGIADPFGALPGDGILGRNAVAHSLQQMAEKLAPVDERASARMEALSRAIATDEGRQRWAEVDLRRAFNTEQLAYAYALQKEGGYAHSTIATADRIRNILVLAPILLTWFALAEASRAYASYITEFPDEVRQPFLLLWERGFGGYASPLAPSFSTVALIDAVIIAGIIALTFYAHGRREAREDAVEKTALHFQTDLDNVLAEASVVLAVDRGSRPAALARNVDRLVERFDQNSQELLTRLRVEHDRLEQLAGRREREFADFGVFASGMRAGAEETHRLLVELRQVSTGLQAALEDLTSEVSATVDQGGALLRAVQGLEQLTSANIQSDQALTRQITAAASALAEAGDKGIAGADAAAQASRVATEAVRGISAIAHDLVASQARLERALTEEVETNTRLAEAMQGSTGGMANSARSLGEIDGNLASLRDEFVRMADGATGQARTLNDLLEQQASVATGLSQVARDISTISMRTAQRQDEVSQDIAALIERLDRVARSMGQGPALEPPENPARRDPESGWPRRRS